MASPSTGDVAPLWRKGLPCKRSGSRVRWPVLSWNSALGRAGPNPVPVRLSRMLGVATTGSPKGSFDLVENRAPVGGNQLSGHERRIVTRQEVDHVCYVGSDGLALQQPRL